MDAQRRRLLWRMTSEKSYNNSTSCLVKNKAEAIAVANATVVPPRHSSTEGRFSILDAHAKSSDSESDFDANQAPITFSRRVIPVSNFSKSVDFSAGTTVLPMSTSVSRFRIVPLESRYKRGRWTCYDYYEKNHVAKNAKLSLPATKNKSFDINNLSVRSLNEVIGPKTAPPLVGMTPQPLHVRFAFDLSSDDEPEIDAKRVPPRKDKPSPPAPAPSQPAASSAPTSVQKMAPVTILTPPATLPALITTEIRADDTKILSAVKAADLGMTLSLNNGRLTPTEMQLQTGLESTLNTCSEAIIGALVQENKVVAKKKSSSSASTTTNTGGNPSMVAIDSKIEQAMDLVKTHLMFAVREEVEVLRGRIVDLENTVCNLEAENAVLRQHVSEEILRNMNN